MLAQQGAVLHARLEGHLGAQLCVVCVCLVGSVVGVPKI